MVREPENSFNVALIYTFFTVEFKNMLQIFVLNKLKESENTGIIFVSFFKSICGLKDI